jgi:hypothetical protein
MHTKYSREETAWEAQAQLGQYLFMGYLTIMSVAPFTGL